MVVVMTCSFSAHAEEDSLAANLKGLELFLDSQMEAYFPKHQLAGATVSVVFEDQVVLLKGYGHSDLEKKNLVDAANTLFRPGSISKLFTWTAIMQLVEDGQIKLNDDVDQHIAQFQIPTRFDEPISIRHLMTHTAGFEDALIGTYARSETQLVPLSQFLAANQPKRIRPPGKYIAYSNYSTNLAGLIVENVSGVAFDRYIEQQVFAPLGMKHSTFSEPIPREWEMARGYDTALNPVGFEYLHNVGPSGSMTTTAADMAMFMLAHLNGGALPGKASSRILEAPTVQRMHQQLFTHNEQLEGNAHGFWELYAGKQRVLWHSGGTTVFHSWLFLIPELKLGFFISFNAAQASAIPRALSIAVLEYLLEPNREHDDQAIDGFESRAEEIEGSYRDLRRSYTKFEKIGSFGTLDFAIAGDGVIALGPRRYREVEPYLFQEIGGFENVLFKTNGSGSVTHALFGAGAADKQSVLTLPYSQLALSLAAVLVCVLGVLLTLLRPRTSLRRCGSQRLANATMLAGNLSVIGFAAAFTVALSSAGNLIFGVPNTVYYALLFPVLAAFLTIPCVYFAFTFWRSQDHSVIQKLWYTTNVGATLLFLSLVAHWNLLGWQL